MTTARASEALRAALRGHDPSDEQWDAITAPLGPQAIVAGAGSGKTAVMTARIVHLVESRLVRPTGVLGLTFTNKAAAELEERLAHAFAALEPHPGEHPTVSTYHAFAQEVVRQHGPRLGISSDAALLSEAQKWQMLMAVVEDLPPLEQLELRHPLSFIPQTLGLSGQCADHCITVDELDAHCDELVTQLERVGDSRSVEATRKRKDLCKIMAAYAAAKRKAGRIDYGDQITIAVRLLESFQDVAASYRDRFPVVLLDEYQDTNPAQKKLMQQVCPPGSAVTAVGDARQAIYAWRGATMFNLIGFPSDFPQADGSPCRPMSLAANYRSGRRIVALANAVIDAVPAERRPGAELVSVEANGDGFVGVELFADQGAEAGWIADRIEESHGRPWSPPDGDGQGSGTAADAGRPLEWRDFAILVRKRRYMDHIVAELERRDIPVEIPELTGLLKVPPVVDAIAWMRVLSDAGPSANRWVARILLGPRYRVHYRDLAPISSWAAKRTMELTREAGELLGLDEPDPGEVAFSLLEALSHADEIEGVSVQARQRIGEFVTLVAELRPEANRPLLELAQAVVDRTGIADTLAASPSRSARALAGTLQTFLGVCAEFSPLSGEPTLGAFLDYLDAAEESADVVPLGATTPSDSVKVMTVHSAKGLEFDVVFLPCLAADQEDTRDGWPKGSVFPDVRTANPMTSAQTLPNSIRDDRAWLPNPDDFRTKRDFQQALKERALEDERRLFYVAVTRAKRELHCSAAWWYGSEDRKGPSRFWREVFEHADATSLRSDPCPEQNPVLGRMSDALAWPPPARVDDDTMTWIARVDALAAGDATEEDVLALGGVDAVRLLSEHATLLDALSAPGVETSTERGAPTSLPATAAVRIALGKETSEAVLAPLPAPPTDAQRLGIEVHAWIEERSRGLVGLADEEAIEETSLAPDHGLVEELKANYGRLGFADRELAALDGGETMTELPFTVKVGGTLVRGRIDAVYLTGTDAGSDDASVARLEIVDFKTGRVPEAFATGEHPEADEWGQLHLYAEALAELGLVKGPVTLTYAYLRDARTVSKRYTPQGLAWLEAGLAHLT